MEFTITQEVSELIIKNGISDYFKEVSDSLSEFLKTKNYGDDLKVLYIGVICVSPEFDFFFKIRKPKYKKGIKIIVQDGREYEQIDALSYDIKLDYSSIVKSNELDVKKRLVLALLDSFVVFDKLKIKVFDRLKFEDEMRSYLESYLHNN